VKYLDDFFHHNDYYIIDYYSHYSDYYTFSYCVVKVIPTTIGVLIAISFILFFLLFSFIKMFPDDFAFIAIVMCSFLLSFS
jgi:hypothetical protein